jgi:thiosulfate/3-mercaptopyruvate sulfurtransferase
MYQQGHIPNAIGWNWQSQLQAHLVRDIVNKNDMETLLSTSGINNDTTVVLYGDNNNWFACWAFWQLKYYGHDDVKIMNGGRTKWESEGRPLVSDSPNHQATSYSIQIVNEKLRAYRDQILSSLLTGSVALVDVRSPDEFNGTLIAPAHVPQEGSQRAGHIPGAANIPWAQSTNDDGTFKPYEDLLQLYASKDIRGDKDTVTYCRIGERSSHTWFVLHQLLGYQNVSNYDGSWTEWGSIVGAPIEK